LSAPPPRGSRAPRGRRAARARARPRSGRSACGLPRGRPPGASGDELHVDVRAGAREELTDRLPALVAEVAREVVHVHADELVAALGVHAATEAERIVERLVTVLERSVDRLAQDGGDLSQGRVAEVAARRVDAERQRQPGLEQPPLPEVEALLEVLVAEGELSLVDEQTRLGATGGDLRQDLVEGQHAVAH